MDSMNSVDVKRIPASLHSTGMLYQSLAGVELKITVSLATLSCVNVRKVHASHINTGMLSQVLVFVSPK